MDFPSYQIAALPDFGSLYFVLFAGFVIAMIIWIILWMLGTTDEKVADTVESVAAEPVADTVEEPEKVAALSEPVEETVSNREAALPDPVEEKASKSDSGDLSSESDFTTASEELAASQFSSELSSGLVKQDPSYGIVYTKAPEEIDDLKKIKGVAKVLEGKLHTIGVYRFKQIAVWTDAACAEFSKLLTFKNRIYKDNWIAQAKDFHKEKYDEEL